MKRKFWAILLITFLLIPQIAHALSYEQVTQKAKEITVLIDGCNSGSGVLYQRQGNTYYVLTAKHMVENRNVNCLVITPDGFRYETNIDKIAIPLSGIDLAVLQFTSERNYTLAEFGDSQKVTGGKTVYVAGAPEPTSAIPKRTLLVTPGNIVGIQSPQNGYEFIYNNSTRRGMSGGALLDKNGKVIGIHGQGDQQDGSKTGLNLAIPSQTFLAAQLPNPTTPLVTPPQQTKPTPTPTPTVSPNPKQETAINRRSLSYLPTKFSLSPWWVKTLVFIAMAWCFFFLCMCLWTHHTT